MCGKRAAARPDSRFGSLREGVELLQVDRPFRRRRLVELTCGRLLDGFGDEERPPGSAHLPVNARASHADEQHLEPPPLAREDGEVDRHPDPAAFSVASDNDRVGRRQKECSPAPSL